MEYLRRTPVWPLFRRVGWPAREAVRELRASARALARSSASTARRTRQRGRSAVSAWLGRHPRLADASWRRLKRLPWRARRARARLASWRVRRDPVGHARRYFDPAWYAAAYPSVPAGEDAYSHFVRFGAAQGYAPNAVFDVAGYAYDNPDIAEYGANPLLHYVLVGRRRGSTPHPLFDADWYRRNHRDVGRADPYLHYLQRGRSEMRATSPAVDPGTDIATASIALDGSPGERVTVIVPAYRNFALTWRCLYALSQRTPGDLRVRVVLADDDPTRPLAPLFAGVDGLDAYTNPVNLGFLRNCNNAIARVQSEFVVLLNSDAVVQSDWLGPLISLAERHPTAALLGCRLIEPDGALQEAAVIMYRDGWGQPYGRRSDPDRPEFRFVRSVDCVSGACLLIRRGAFVEVGGFDDSFAPAFFEEYDLAFALRAAGHEVLYQPASSVVHGSAASYGRQERDRLTAVNHERFVGKWSEQLAAQYHGPDDEFLARERHHAGGIVVVVDDRVPEHDHGAGALVTRSLIELLLEADMKVVLVPDDGLERGRYAEELRQLGVEVLAPRVDFEAWLQANGRYVDRVLLSRPLVALRHLPALRRWTRARIVYCTQDLHHLREQRRFATTGDHQARGLASYLQDAETRVLRKVDAVVTLSPAEVEVIQRLAPGQSVAVVPPFVATAASASGPSRPLADRDAVMFLGGFEHRPNVDAAQVLVNEVMPAVWQAVPQARLLLVGSDPPAEVRSLASPQVVVTGYVQELESFFGQARATVSPLRFGAGIKIKILASLAAGVPVVTTPIGNEGIGLRHGHEALIGDSPADLAVQVVRLFREPGLAEELAGAGQLVLRTRFSRETARGVLLATLRGGD